MNFDFDVIYANSIVIVPVVVALVEAIKLTQWVKTPFIPLLSIVVGMLVGWLTGYSVFGFGTTIFHGVIYGLLASGLYSGVKTTYIANLKQKVEKENKKARKEKSTQGEKK